MKKLIIWLIRRLIIRVDLWWYSITRFSRRLDDRLRKIEQRFDDWVNINIEYRIDGWLETIVKTLHLKKIPGIITRTFPGFPFVSIITAFLIVVTWIWRTYQEWKKRK